MKLADEKPMPKLTRLQSGDIIVEGIVVGIDPPDKDSDRTMVLLNNLSIYITLEKEGHYEIMLGSPDNRVTLLAKYDGNEYTCDRNVKIYCKGYSILAEYMTAYGSRVRAMHLCELVLSPQFIFAEMSSNKAYPTGNLFDGMKDIWSRVRRGPDEEVEEHEHL
ncbi:MAG: hypothetical protein Q8M92_02650 [Candidatus Subteraquimicrobiales bacterium]|nr:hypothetical protein [Candidatus Subteraquimicrobiales bacterium]